MFSRQTETISLTAYADQEHSVKQSKNSQRNLTRRLKMDINKIYANVRLVVPDATTIEMNKYMLATLDEINAKTSDSPSIQSQASPAGMESSMPEERKDGQGFNDYPDLKCLILPSEITLLSRVICKDKTAIAVYEHPP